MSRNADAFSDPDVVERYAEQPPRAVPGFHDMQRMAGLLIAERAPANARVLVLGAGGGLETKLFAQSNPGWTFDGVDPSAPMLDLAKKTLGPFADRARLTVGRAADAPEGPFDAAACILTMHFMPLEERRNALAELKRRLKPGSPLVVAHFSFPQRDQAERGAWLRRYAAFQVSSGVEPEQAENARKAVDARLTLLSPEQDEALLREAGFSDVALFYAGFSFRGWVALA